MKCPKCGYNSFEFLDKCKKCGAGLDSFKKSLGIVPIVFSHQSAGLQAGRLSVSGAVPQAVPLSDGHAEDSFTWDIPEPAEGGAEPLSAPESGFSGFDLDFIKEETAPADQESAFSFNEELSADIPADTVEKTAKDTGKFSFYEETLDPEEHSFSFEEEEETRESQNDPFGETGVMGEILPEQLQEHVLETGPDDIIGDSLPELEPYEQELVLEDLEEVEQEVKAEETGTEKVPQKDPLDFSDFEKEFESIFQSDDASDDGKQ